MKLLDDAKYAESARNSIKRVMAEMKLKTKGLFILLYGREPEDNEEQTLRNRLNRGNLTSEFIGLCVSKMPPLQLISMSGFFEIKDEVRVFGDQQASTDRSSKD
jgi:hypothetical protein